jgi:hypothetical protein
VADGGGVRAAARGGGDVPGRGAGDDRSGCLLPRRHGAAVAAAGGAGGLLPDPGGRVCRVVRGLARGAGVHHVQRRVPVRAGGGLRLVPRAEPAQLRAAALPGTAARAAQRGLLYLGSAVTAVGVPAAGGDVAGRGGARLRPADPAAPAAGLRRGGGTGFPVRVRAGARGGAGTLFAGVPAVPPLHPARPAGCRVARGARVPAAGRPAQPGSLPDRVRALVLRAGAGVRGRARAGPGGPHRRRAPPGQAGQRGSAVHGERGAGSRSACAVRHL